MNFGADKIEYLVKLIPIATMIGPNKKIIMKINAGKKNRNPVQRRFLIRYEGLALMINIFFF